MDPDQRLSCRGLRIWQFTQFHTVDPIQLLCQRYAHVAALLTAPMPTSDVATGRAPAPGPNFLSG